MILAYRGRIRAMIYGLHWFLTALALYFAVRQKQDVNPHPVPHADFSLRSHLGVQTIECRLAKLEEGIHGFWLLLYEDGEQTDVIGHMKVIVPKADEGHDWYTDFALMWNPDGSGELLTNSFGGGIGISSRDFTFPRHSKLQGMTGGSRAFGQSLGHWNELEIYGICASQSVENSTSHGNIVSSEVNGNSLFLRHRLTGHKSVVMFGTKRFTTQRDADDFDRTLNRSDTKSEAEHNSSTPPDLPTTPPPSKSQ